MMVHIRKNDYELGCTLLKWRNIRHMMNHPIHHFLQERTKGLLNRLQKHPAMECHLVLEFHLAKD